MESVKLRNFDVGLFSALRGLQNDHFDLSHLLWFKKFLV